MAGEPSFRPMLLLLLAVILAPAGLAAGAGAPTRVIGAYQAAIRACPSPTCSVIGAIPLDEPIAVTGVPIDGFVPVRHERSAGFVAATYLYRPGGTAPAPEFAHGSPGCQRVALIFNIGAGYTPAVGILDTLVADEVPATMFVMGWWAEQNPDLLRRMIDDGFTIGSHGHLPTELTLRSDDDIEDDLRAAAAAIKAAGGKRVGPWFTPFAAAIDDRVRAIAATQGYLSIGWSVRSEDWNPAVGDDEIYARVVGDVTDGSIVELHLDASTSVDSTATALPWIIEDLRAQGYRFVTIAEMLEPCPAATPEPAQGPGPG